jgi:hypothetical protein
MPGYPTEDDLRRALKQRISQFTALTGRSRRQIGLAAVNDSAAVFRMLAGGNFTIGTYKRVMEWLDRNWPRQPKAARCGHNAARERPPP